jgi:hypothetical protein
MSYRAAQWCLFVAFLAHNVEEGATVGTYLPHSQSLLSRHFGMADAAARITPASFAWALVAVSAAALVLVGFGRRQPFLPVLLAAVMLVNVVVPHVPAAVALGGYAPGVVTAVLVILPYSIWFLLRSIREGQASWRGVVGALVAAPVLITVSIGAVFLITLAATVAPNQ